MSPGGSKAVWGESSKKIDKNKPAETNSHKLQKFLILSQLSNANYFKHVL